MGVFVLMISEGTRVKNLFATDCISQAENLLQDSLDVVILISWGGIVCNVCDVSQVSFRDI